MKLNELTIKEASEKLAKKEISSVELTQACIDRVKKVDPKLNAFLFLAEQSAMLAAKEADKQIANNANTFLTGIPYAVKDNILVKGTKTTAASKILENYESTYDATVIKRLSQAAPVMLGKTNLDEFAMGASTENSAFGPTRNPFDLERVAGGSSGGSAAAVAADEAIFALGSDTAGSIRQPASFCGVVGLKPTYGRVSRYGLIAMCSSLDQIGVLTKTVEDTAISFQLLAGQDEFDTTTLPKHVPDYTRSLNLDVRGVKIGIPKEFFIEGLDQEVRNIIQSAIKQFETLGAEIIETSLPNVPYSVAAYYIITPVEISANLSRFDGIRYGLSVAGKSLDEVYFKSRSKGFGAEVKRRIMIGSYASSAGYFDAYYKKAKQIQTLIRDDFTKAFEKVDLLLTPVSPHAAFKIGEKADPLAMYLEDVFTGPLNLAGVPGLSVPAGATESGLPVNLQLVAPHFQEEKLIQAGHAFEQALGLKLKPRLTG
ncbi:MAG: Asp-tRNA(Asn)/Glu-tRNA(Gln) amidotransferase subunit GatA [Candidatus Doudnabacteria bacterium]|nr:Asp-tRNA(Asn)/Glu-tRNA(Gln) amidotransferase subunit GatA [Candidatus Doudnabacteria bacterium]